MIREAKELFILALRRDGCLLHVPMAVAAGTSAGGDAIQERVVGPQPALPHIFDGVREYERHCPQLEESCRRLRLLSMSCRILLQATVWG